jgi:hypothetical protein
MHLDSSVVNNQNCSRILYVHEVTVVPYNDITITGTPETICGDSARVYMHLDSSIVNNQNCSRILYVHEVTVVPYNDITITGTPETICGDSARVYMHLDSSIVNNQNCSRILYVHEVTVVLFTEVSGVVKHITCNGLNNGEISLVFSTPSVDIFWSNGEVDANINNLSAGIYSVTVTTASGCETKAMFTINEPLPLSLESTMQNPNCFGSSNGLLDVFVEGGTAPYMYAWSNGSADHLQVGLGAGAYSVTVSDANGCQNGTSFQLIQPDSISITAVLQPTSCEGLPSGAIDLTATGGTGTLSYDWNDFFSQEDRTGLPDGQYAVTVTDENGCQADSVFHIKENGCHVWYSHGELHIIIGRCGELPTFDFEVKVYDVNGKEVKSFSGTAINGYFDGVFNVSDLPTGLYNVTVIGENDEVRHGSRFFKQ